MVQCRNLTNNWKLIFKGKSYSTVQKALLSHQIHMDVLATTHPSTQTQLCSYTTYAHSVTPEAQATFRIHQRRGTCLQETSTNLRALSIEYWRILGKPPNQTETVLVASNWQHEKNEINVREHDLFPSPNTFDNQNDGHRWLNLPPKTPHANEITHRHIPDPQHCCPKLTHKQILAMHTEAGRHIRTHVEIG
jgi:hypothetical protein